MFNSEPTVVLYKSLTCGYCDDLSKIWDIPPSGSNISIMDALKRVNPKIRFSVVTAKDQDGRFDEKLYPSDLIRYGGRFPTILLIPGSLWDAAMSKLGSKNDVKLIDGVQIMNGKWENNILRRFAKYNIMNPEDYSEWLIECQNDENFRRVQSDLSSFIITNRSSSLITSNKTPLITCNDNVCSLKLIPRKTRF
jgi:hypothetical protein